MSRTDPAQRARHLGAADAFALPLWDALVVVMVIVLAVAALALRMPAGRAQAGAAEEARRAQAGAVAPAMRLAGAADAARPDLDYVPLVTVSPVYPPLAQQQGIEGRCTVEYTIEATGAVRHVHARGCTPTGLFEQAAVEAARQFKYRPRLRAGEPVAVGGVRNEFQFSLPR